MKSIKIAWWLSLLVLSTAWLMVEPGVFTTNEFIPLRNLLVQYSGALAMGWMSLAMLLAARPKFAEAWFGGLDKMYRFHKWLGISVAVISVFHWFMSKAPKWAVALGLLERRQRGPRPEAANQIEQWFSGYRGLAESIGEWMFYGTLILILIALVKKISYRSFYKTHRLFALVYLGLVFHTVILTKFSYWTSPVGLILLPLLMGGVVAAVLSLFKKIGFSRQGHGIIEHIEYYPGVNTLEVGIKDLQGWRGHQPGQFAFVTSDAAEGAHPFTIASSWRESDAKITFIVKELGDYTASLKEALHVGQKMRIEGPYGCFTFDDDRSTQVWIGGGIGITPFVARMKFLAENKASFPQTIYLFHSTGQADESALAKLTADAKAAGVHLHIFVDVRGDRLTGEKIRELVKNWRESSFWFCGPVGLGNALKADFATAGEAIDSRFHQELFNMR
ncbi:MAG: ferric reductase [Bdellovibrio sp. ArHS]|uniref:ferredoxin reductase family protein n=1 Tax=Bdellovibrio sp. ArHS TaxID=1569284 RepID=UPI000583B8DD|nr:ferric reductase-like transmembrane domain-containing protein [Bdellovibrio sp. ArHS]KHD87489.1 MAG: ferric reductase [Bdellovibrio sp. ArHS]